MSTTLVTDPEELAKKYLQQPSVPLVATQTVPLSPPTETIPSMPQTERATPKPTKKKKRSGLGTALHLGGEGLHYVNEGIGLTNKYVAQPSLGLAAKGIANDNPISNTLRDELAWVRKANINIPYLNVPFNPIMTVLPALRLPDMITPNNEEEAKAIRSANGFTKAWHARTEHINPIYAMAAEIVADPTTWITAGSAEAVIKIPFVAEAMEKSPAFARGMRAAEQAANISDRIQALPIHIPIKGVQKTVKGMDFAIERLTGKANFSAGLKALSPASKLVIMSREVDQALRNFFSHGGQSVSTGERGAVGVADAATSRLESDTIRTIGELNSQLKIDPRTGQTLDVGVPTSALKRTQILDTLNPEQLAHVYNRLDETDPAFNDVMDYFEQKGYITQTQRNAARKAAGGIENLPATNFNGGQVTPPVTAAVPPAPPPVNPVNAANTPAPPSATNPTKKMVINPQGTGWIPAPTGAVPTVPPAAVLPTPVPAPPTPPVPAAAVLPTPPVTGASKVWTPQHQATADDLLDKLQGKQVTQNLSKNPRKTGLRDVGPILDNMDNDELALMAVNLNQIDPIKYRPLLKQIDKAAQRKIPGLAPSTAIIREPKPSDTILTGPSNTRVINQELANNTAIYDGSPYVPASVVEDVEDGPFRSRFMNKLVMEMQSLEADPDEIAASILLTDHLAQSLSRRNEMFPTTESIFSTFDFKHAQPGIRESELYRSIPSQTLGATSVIAQAHDPINTIKSLIELYDFAGTKFAHGASPFTVYAHEMAHVIRFMLPDQDVQRLAGILDSFSLEHFGTLKEEAIPLSMEKYLQTGKLPEGMKAMDQTFLAKVYGDLYEMMKQTWKYLINIARPGSVRPEIVNYWDEFFKTPKAFEALPMEQNRRGLILSEAGARRTGNTDILARNEEIYKRARNSDTGVRFGVNDPVPKVTNPPSMNPYWEYGQPYDRPFGTPIINPALPVPADYPVEVLDLDKELHDLYKQSNNLDFEITKLGSGGRQSPERIALKKQFDDINNRIIEAETKFEQLHNEWYAKTNGLDPTDLDPPDDMYLSTISQSIEPDAARIYQPYKPNGKLKKSYEDLLFDVANASDAGDAALVSKLIDSAGLGKRRAIFDALDQNEFKGDTTLIEQKMKDLGHIEHITAGVDRAPVMNGTRTRFQDDIANYAPQNLPPSTVATVGEVLQETANNLTQMGTPPNPARVPEVEAMIKSVLPTNPDKFSARWMWQDATVREHLHRALTAATPAEARDATAAMFHAMNMKNSAFGVMHPALFRFLDKVLPHTANTVDKGLPKVFENNAVGNAIVSDNEVETMARLMADPEIAAFQKTYEEDISKVSTVLDKYAGAPALDDYTTARQLHDAIDKKIITDPKDITIVKKFLKDYDMTEEAAEKVAAKGVKNRLDTAKRGLDTFSVQEAYLEKLIDKHWRIQAKTLNIDLNKTHGAFMKSLSWIPKAWREQALLSPRYHLANVMDMTVKSLIHGVNPIHNMGAKDFAQHELEMSSLPMGVFVHDDTRDLGQIGQLDEFLGQGSTTAVGAIPGIGVPADKVVRFNRAFARGSENAFRQWAWHNQVKDTLHAFRPQFDTEVRRLMPGAAGANLIADMDKMGQGFRRTEGISFGPNKIREMALQRGADDSAANELLNTWKNAIDQASIDGVAMSNKVHFDFEKTYAIEDKLMLRKFLPFHFFATRNLPFYLETLAAHPEVVNAWQAYQDVSEQDRINMGLPSKYKGYIPVGDGFLHGIFGPGQMFFNPSSLLSIADQGKNISKLTEGDPYAETSMRARVGSVLDRASGIGAGPAPWVQIPLSALGFYGAKDETLPILRLSSVVQAATGRNALSDLVGFKGLNKGKGYDLGEERVRHGIDAIRSLPIIGTGKKVVTKSGSAYRDNQIVNRLAELSRANIQQAGVGENSKEAQDIRDAFTQASKDGPGNPLWDEAESYVRSSQNGMALQAFVNPLPAKVATDDAMDISATLNELPPGFLDYYMQDPEFARYAKLGGSADAVYKGYDRPDVVDSLTGDTVFDGPDTYDPTQLDLWGGTMWGPTKPYPYNSYTVMKGYNLWAGRQPAGTPKSPEAFFKAIHLIGGQ
jgi:hypothetical protein